MKSIRLYKYEGDQGFDFYYLDASSISPLLIPPQLYPQSAYKKTKKIHEKRRLPRDPWLLNYTVKYYHLIYRGISTLQPDIPEASTVVLDYFRKRSSIVPLPASLSKCYILRGELHSVDPMPPARLGPRIGVVYVIRYLPILTTAIPRGILHLGSTNISVEYYKAKFVLGLFGYYDSKDSKYRLYFTEGPLEGTISNTRINLKASYLYLPLEHEDSLLIPGYPYYYVVLENSAMLDNNIKEFTDKDHLLVLRKYTQKAFRKEKSPGIKNSSFSTLIESDLQFVDNPVYFTQLAVNASNLSLLTALSYPIVRPMIKYLAFVASRDEKAEGLSINSLKIKETLRDESSPTHKKSSSQLEGPTSQSVEDALSKITLLTHNRNMNKKVSCFTDQEHVYWTMERRKKVYEDALKLINFHKY